LVHAGKHRTEDKIKIQAIQKLNTPRKSKQYKTQQNKTSLIQSLLTTLGQETEWAYCTTLPSSHGTQKIQDRKQIRNREKTQTESQEKTTAHHVWIILTESTQSYDESGDVRLEHRPRLR